MTAAEELHPETLTVLGVLCELVEADAFIRAYAGRVGQLAVRVRHVSHGLRSERFELDLRGGAIAPVYSAGSTIEEAASIVECVLRARADAIADARSALHLDAANDEPLTDDDRVRLRREAAECEEQERAEQERAYEMHLRDVQRGVA